MFIVKFFKTYFDTTLDLKIQVFNLLAIVGMVAGTGLALVGISLRDSMIPGVNNISIAVLSFALLYIANKKKCYLACSRVFVVVVFLVLFPITFFYCGGYRSGAIFIFVIALVFTAILLDNKERIFALVFEFGLYVFCCFRVFYWPETAYALPTEDKYFYVMIINFTAACIVILIVITMQMRLFGNRQKRIDGLVSELTARNEELALYDSMKSDFLATVAHEINSPLAVITASSNDTIDLLYESPPKTDEILENQEIIKKRVKTIDTILLDLMDTVAIESGRLTLNCQPVGLSDLLKSICSAQFKRLDANKNRIAFDLEAGLPKIPADAARIEQVMTNLLSNACRHTKNGIVTVKLAQADGRQVVSVSDDGEGMGEEMVQLLLSGHTSTKADYWRHGIGLYVCRRIVAEHGGEIRIDSAPGRGTTVSFLLKEDRDG
ncbi:MAG: HAMP domain-containing histidine kinase [Clostridiales bacterium]|nr:HAMP domain-containing histidine kinase [Clostridiales bacterium]